MVFDIRTLLVAVTLATAFCAGARLLLWRMNPSIAGLGRWALAGAAAAIAILLIIAFGKTHSQSLLSLAQFFAIAGLILSWDGFRRFIEITPLSKLALIILFSLSLVWITTVQLLQSIEVRAIGNAMIISILSALIARDLLTTLKPVPTAMRVTGWIYTANALVFFIRTFAGNHAVQPMDPLNPNGVAVFIILWWLCTIIAITLGMVLMTSERLQSELNRQANRDPLTGALNRRSFSLLAEKAMARCKRYNEPLSLMIMDLDKFKQINDRLGHDAGDIILCQFVIVAKKILRSEDVFCRFGGEEFIAILPDTSAEHAFLAAERLRNAFATDSAMLDSISNNNQNFAITVSIGIAELKQGESLESLQRHADTALYQAKETGRNCCHIYA